TSDDPKLHGPAYDNLIPVAAFPGVQDALRQILRGRPADDVRVRVLKVAFSPWSRPGATADQITAETRYGFQVVLSDPGRVEYFCRKPGQPITTVTFRTNGQPFDGPDPRATRAVRAVALLEHIATPEAIAHLKDL